MVYTKEEARTLPITIRVAAYAQVHNMPAGEALMELADLGLRYVTEALVRENTNKNEQPDLPLYLFKSWLDLVAEMEAEREG